MLMGFLYREIRILRRLSGSILPKFRRQAVQTRCTTSTTCPTCPGQAPRGNVCRYPRRTEQWSKREAYTDSAYTGAGSVLLGGVFTLVVVVTNLHKNGTPTVEALASQTTMSRACIGWPGLRRTWVRHWNLNRRLHHLYAVRVLLK